MSNAHAKVAASCFLIPGLFDLAFLPGQLIAQIDSAQWTEKVVERTCAMVPDGSVTPTNDTTKFSSITRTASTGDDTGDNLFPGTCGNQAEAPGIQKYRVRGVNFCAQQVATVDVHLAAGNVALHSWRACNFWF
jgi:hypothetical protein